MPKIVVKRGDEKYKEFLIRPSLCQISVGSEGDNDLIIADKNVALHHLLIFKEGNQYFVEDQNSQFGTMVNEKKVENRTTLSNGDSIFIGEHCLIFENELIEDISRSAIQTSPEKESMVDKALPGESADFSSEESPFSFKKNSIEAEGSFFRGKIC